MVQSVTYQKRVKIYVREEHEVSCLWRLVAEISPTSLQTLVKYSTAVD